MSLLLTIFQGKEPKIEEFTPPDEDCPLREASSRKIPKLTVKVREGQLFTCPQGPSLPLRGGDHDFTLIGP